MYEGLKFSCVKFYHDLSAGSKNLPRKLQNFGDNWPLASISTSGMNLNVRLQQVYRAVPIMVHVKQS